LYFLTVRSCPRLLGEHVQKVSQKLTTRIGKEILFPCAWQGPFFAKKQVSCHNFWMESPFWVKIVFTCTLLIFPPLLKFSKNHDKKKSYNCMTKGGKMIHLSPWAFRGKRKVFTIEMTFFIFSSKLLAILSFLFFCFNFFLLCILYYL
jgi:hypothetical protein